VGEGSGAVTELPYGSWRSLKAHIAGRLGELFALAWLARRRAPEGEIWGLRRGVAAGRELSLWSPSEEPSAWRELSFPVRRLLDAMSPPGFFSFFGLPSSFRGELRHMLSAWVPRREEISELARLLLALSEKREWPWPPAEELARELERRHPGVEAEKALAAEIARATHLAVDSAALYVVEAPASEFKALDLILKACRASDFVLLKWRALRRLAKAEARVEVPRSQPVCGRRSGLEHLGPLRWSPTRRDCPFFGR